MMKGWKQVTLESVCSKIVDCEHKTAPTQEHGYPSIRTPNIGRGRLLLEGVNRVSEETWNEWTKREVPQAGDLIFAREAPLGNVAIVPADTKLCLGQRTVLLRPNSNIVDPHFLCYLLLSPPIQHSMHARGGGATVPHLNVKEIRQLPISIPSLSIQQKIGALLATYDDLIENNLKRIKLLEEMAQITYEEWFVRMRFPGHESSLINPETALPEGWTKKENGDCCEVSGGGTPSREVSEYWEGGNIKWFSPTDLTKSSSLCLLDSSNKITELGLKKSSAKIMGAHTFMMTSRATIGLFGLIDAEYSTNQGFINVTPLKPTHKYYLLFNFKCRVDEFLGHASGATFPEISKSKFKKLKIVWPSENLISDFDKYCSPIISEMTNLTKQNARLREARNILLPRLMTSVIDVESYDPAGLLKEAA